MPARAHYLGNAHARQTACGRFAPPDSTLTTTADPGEVTCKRCLAAMTTTAPKEPTAMTETPTPASTPTTPEEEAEARTADRTAARAALDAYDAARSAPTGYDYAAAESMHTRIVDLIADLAHLADLDRAAMVAEGLDPDGNGDDALRRATAHYDDEHTDDETEDGEYETPEGMSATCLGCGFTTSDRGTLDLWNGYGECPRCEPPAGSRWTHPDGTVTTVDADGNATTTSPHTDPTTTSPTA